MSISRRSLLARSTAVAVAGCTPTPVSTGATGGNTGPTASTGDSGTTVEAPTDTTATTGDTGTAEPDWLTPEMFGAVGDGVTCDYAALVAMANALKDGSVVHFRKGATYRINQLKEGSPSHVRPLPRGRNGVDDIVVHANDLVLHLNGARIEHGPIDRRLRKGDRLSRDVTVVPLFLDRCERVVVNGPGGFYGPAASSTKEDGIGEGPCHGVCVYGGADIEFNDVTFAQWLADGLWVGAYGEVTTKRITAGAVRTNRCLFANNARQGVSIVGCTDYRDVDSVMRDTGHTAYGFHSPGAGCDVEPQPNQTAATNARFEGTRFIDNTGAVFASSDRYGSQVATVELIGVTASFDPGKAARNRAVTQAFTVSNDTVEIRDATLTNVYVRAGESCALTMSNCTSTVTDPSIPALTYAPNTTPTMAVTGCTFDYAPPSTTVTVPFKTLAGTFETNLVFVNGAAHDAASDDLVAQFGGATLSKNQWSTDTPASLPWVIEADGPDTDAYTGPIYRAT